MGSVVTALVAVAAELTTQIDGLELELADHFEQRVRDDPNRSADAKCRKNYTGTSPIPKASGRSRVVLARYARNKRLADACQMWAFAALASDHRVNGCPRVSGRAVAVATMNASSSVATWQGRPSAH